MGWENMIKINYTKNLIQKFKKHKKNPEKQVLGKP